jgi:hypothetical protein
VLFAPAVSSFVFSVAVAVWHFLQAASFLIGQVISCAELDDSPNTRNICIRSSVLRSTRIIVPYSKATTTFFKIPSRDAEFCELMLPSYRPMPPAAELSRLSLDDSALIKNI